MVANAAGVDFGIRLNEAMDDAGHPQRGRTVLLALQFNLTRAATSGWLKGLNIPEAERVRHLADMFSVNYEWLRFGEGPKAKSAGLDSPRTKQLFAMMEDAIFEAALKAGLIAELPQRPTAMDALALCKSLGELGAAGDSQQLLKASEIAQLMRRLAPPHNKPIWVVLQEAAALGAARAEVLPTRQG